MEFGQKRNRCLDERFFPFSLLSVPSVQSVVQIPLCLLCVLCASVVQSFPFSSNPHVGRLMSSTTPRPLTVAEIELNFDSAWFPYATTKEVEPLAGIVAQPRAVRA